MKKNLNEERMEINTTLIFFFFFSFYLIYHHYRYIIHGEYLSFEKKVYGKYETFILEEG